MKSPSQHQIAAAERVLLAALSKDESGIGPFEWRSVAKAQQVLLNATRLGYRVPPHLQRGFYSLPEKEDEVL